MRLKTKAFRKMCTMDIGTTRILEYFTLFPVTIKYNQRDKEGKYWLEGKETRWLEKVKIKQVFGVKTHGSKYFIEWQNYGWENHEFIDE
jgi:hypothetical protein